MPLLRLIAITLGLLAVLGHFYAKETAQVQAIQRNNGWTLTCFESPEGLVNFLNTTPEGDKVIEPFPILQYDTSRIVDSYVKVNHCLIWR